MDKNFNVKNVVDFLISGDKDKNRLVLLFDNSKQIRDFSDVIGSSLKNDINVKLSGAYKYKIQKNLLQVNENKIYIGLKNEEDLLLNNYSEDVIRYFSDDEG